MSKEKLTHEIVTITPELAAKWIQNDKFDNRRLDERRIVRIANDIKKGKWVMDGTPIRFNGKDDIIDGQHRLHAIRRAGKPVQSLVIRGLPTAAKDTIDTGKARTVGDVLHFHGHLNTAVLAAAARLVIAYREYDGDLMKWAGSHARGTLSHMEIIQEAETNELLVKATQATVSLKYLKKMCGGGAQAFCYYLFSSVSSQHIAGSFFQSVEKGDNLSSDSPILALRNALALRDTNAGSSGYARTVYNIAIFIKAWNAWRAKEPLSRLVYRRDEVFPKPSK